MSDLHPSGSDELPPPPPPPVDLNLSVAPPTSAPGDLGHDPAPEVDRTNVAGLIAFISSLLGFCVPVLPSLVALVLGIVGVMRPRRGLAIAALVLSVIQFALWGLISVLIVTAVNKGVAQLAITVAVAEAELRDALGNQKPGEDAFGSGGLRGEDGWGTPFRTEVIDVDGARTVFVWSAGADREFDTDDDFVAASSPRDAARKAGKPLPRLD